MIMVASEWIRWILPRPLRNALRAPHQTIESWKLSTLFLLGRHSTQRVRQDWEVRCHPVSLIAFQTHAEIAEFRQELDGFVQHCTPGMILLDIGSHYGVFTLAALHYGGSKARVIAIDPSPTAKHILIANLKLADKMEQVFLIDAAVGATNGTLSMLSTGASGAHMLVSSSQRRDSAQITMHTIPSIIEMTGLKPTHIKIDVEGYEDQVITGARMYLEQQKPKIFLELHSKMMRDAGKSPEAVLYSLLDMGYTSFERHSLPITIMDALDMDICRLVITAS
jgi:FkbM family methyltransferase